VPDFTNCYLSANSRNSKTPTLSKTGGEQLTTKTKEYIEPSAPQIMM